MQKFAICIRHDPWQMQLQISFATKNCIGRTLVAILRVQIKLQVAANFRRSLCKFCMQTSCRLCKSEYSMGVMPAQSGQRARLRDDRPNWSDTEKIEVSSLSPSQISISFISSNGPWFIFIFCYFRR